MKQYEAKKIKNIALVGHGSCGKTSVAEAMVYLAGASDRLGKVDDGNTVFDFDPEEIKRKREQIAAEQKELEEAEKQYQEQLNKIRYVADDEKIEMLIPREKMIKLIQGLTDAINNNKDAKSYKVTINL